MILVKTAHYIHKYSGDVTIEFVDNAVHVTCHHETSHPIIESDDDLVIWASDIFDWFFIGEIVSIKGV